MKGTGLTALPRHAQESSLYWFPILACCVRACKLEEHELTGSNTFVYQVLVLVPPAKAGTPQKSS